MLARLYSGGYMYRVKIRRRRDDNQIDIIHGEELFVATKAREYKIIRHFHPLLD